MLDLDMIVNCSPFVLIFEPEPIQKLNQMHKFPSFELIFAVLNIVD